MEIKNKAPLLVSLFVINSAFAGDVVKEKGKMSDEALQLSGMPSGFSAQMIHNSLANGTPKVKSVNTAELEVFNKDFEEYLVTQFNQPDYAIEISENGSDLVTLLEAIKEARLGEEGLFKAYTVLKLFHDKYKSVDFIFHTVPLQILPAMPSLLSTYLTPRLNTTLEDIKDSIEYLLQLKLLEHFSEFAMDPDTTLSSIAEMLATRHLEIRKEFMEELENINKFRSITVRFVESLINKVMWDEKDPAGLWHSTMLIANGLKGLFACGILDDEDDLDSLYWSLTHRFAFFLDLRGSLLPVNFYSDIEDDISNGVVEFIEEEQDDFIITKRETLVNAIAKAKIRALAFHQNGIVSDEINIEEGEA